MLLAPNFPLTPAGYFGAMVHRMLEWLTLRVRRADQGYQPALSPHVRAQTQALHDRMARVGVLFARLAELARTGRLRRYPDRAAPRPRDAASPAAAFDVRSAGVFTAMRGPGWMLEFVPADFTAHMAQLLRITDVVLLIQTAPSVARLVRPLCRGLGVPLPPGVFPPPPRRPRRPRRRPTPDAPAPLPGAAVVRHRSTCDSQENLRMERHPPLSGGPSGCRVTSYWDERDLRRAGVGQKPG